MNYSTSGIRNSIKQEFSIYQSSRIPFADLGGIDNRFKIIFIAEGSCSVESKNGIAALIAPALVLLDEKTRVRVIEKDNPLVRAVLFHPGFLNSKFDFKNIRRAAAFSHTERQDIYFLDVFIKNGVTIFNTIGLGATARAGGLFKKMEDILAKQERNCWPCDARCCLIEILFFLRTLADDVGHNAWINQIVFSEPARETAALDVNKILSHLNTHYDEKISIEKLAMMFHTNRTTLSAAFKQSTGLSLLNYLSKIRMQIASSLLQNTVLKVYEIMVKVGYTDPSHFLKSFKKHTGYTPAHFRKINTWIRG